MLGNAFLTLLKLEIKFLPDSVHKAYGFFVKSLIYVCRPLVSKLWSIGPMIPITRASNMLQLGNHFGRGPISCMHGWVRKFDINLYMLKFEKLHTILKQINDLYLTSAIAFNQNILRLQVTMYYIRRYNLFWVGWLRGDKKEKRLQVNFDFFYKQKLTF